MNCLFAPLEVNCIRMQIKVFKAQCISDLLLLVFAFPKRHFIPKMSTTKKSFSRVYARMCGLQCILDNELCSYTIGRRSQTFLIFMTVPLFFLRRFYDIAALQTRNAELPFSRSVTEPKLHKNTTIPTKCNAGG